MYTLINYQYILLNDSPPVIIIVLLISLEQQLSSEAFCTCSYERAVGIAIGTLILVEGIIAGVVVIIIVLCKLVMRYVNCEY